MRDLLVEMTGITKDFPGVHALADASFELRPGEVHALVGENGAGKSTLMKILAGVYQPDAGEIRFKGEPVQIANPRTALDLGISMIHQELNLAPHLTVAQNIFLGREPRGRPRFLLDDRRLNRQTQELIERLHLKLDPRARVGDLKIAQQQMVEIAKALSLNAAVLVMDEPTAALTDTEIDELFRIIRDLRANGVGVVHISHRLEELKQISDRVTVMRDGRYVATLETADAEIPSVINMMVGRAIYEAAPEIPERDPTRSSSTSAASPAAAWCATSRSCSTRARFSAWPGWSVRAGRRSSGRSSARTGRNPARSMVHGRRVDIRSPADAVKLGIAYLSEDRKRYGLALGMNVETNIVLASLNRFMSSFGRIDTGRTRAVAEQRVQDLGIKTPSVRQRARNLSGGTQQKVVIAKWLTADTDILIFDEPTRGIDVGAKSEIYHLLNELARDGKSIIMISSELPEILRMSHRIIVMCEGRLTGELDGASATQEQIMTFATQRASVAEAVSA